VDGGRGSPTVRFENQGTTQITRAVPLNWDPTLFGGDLDHPVIWDSLILGKDRPFVTLLEPTRIRERQKMTDRVSAQLHEKLE